MIYTAFCLLLISLLVWAATKLFRYESAREFYNKSATKESHKVDNEKTDFSHSTTGKNHRFKFGSGLSPKYYGLFLQNVQGYSHQRTNK